MLVSDWSGVSTGALEFNDFKQQAHKLEFTFYPDRLKYDSAEGATVSFNLTRQILLGNKKVLAPKSTPSKLTETCSCPHQKAKRFLEKSFMVLWSDETKTRLTGPSDKRYTVKILKKH